MAARKSILKPAPERPQIDALLQAAMGAKITDEQIQEQRASFAYGNARVDSGVTKDSARKAARSNRLMVA
jgi:hypothetical protein